MKLNKPYLIVLAFFWFALGLICKYTGSPLEYQIIFTAGFVVLGIGLAIEKD